MRKIRLINGVSTMGQVLNDEIVGNYVVEEEGNEPSIITNFESDEVVKISSTDTIGTLKRKGYIVPVANICEGDTLLMHRSNCVLHSVKPLQTLNEISKYYNVPVDQIMATNSLKTTKLYVGQILII